MSKKSPVPAGAMMELNLDLIGEGSFRRKFERAIRRAVKELLAYEQETQDQKGKSQVVAKITVARLPSAKDHFNVSFNVKTATPTANEVSVVKARGGRLLCQPVGASEWNPDQQVLFDAQGRAIQGTDPDTGEVVSGEGEKDVAGKIERAAAVNE